MTAPAPDEGRTERVAALLARHWSYEPTTVYDEWLCECGARIMGSDGDTDTAMQAHVADQILAVLAAVGPECARDLNTALTADQPTAGGDEGGP